MRETGATSCYKKKHRTIISSPPLVQPVHSARSTQRLGSFVGNTTVYIERLGPALRTQNRTLTPVMSEYDLLLARAEAGVARRSYPAESGVCSDDCTEVGTTAGVSNGATSSLPVKRFFRVTRLRLPL